VGSVVMLALWFGFQILIVPSQEEERKVSLATRFQCTLKTSRACSLHDWMGNWSTLMSKSLTEPSPPAVRSCDSCASDQQESKSESCVSNLCGSVQYSVPGSERACERWAYHFSATIPLAVSPRIYSLPFPTRPKFAELATAMRESKNGEYLTL
jgi:hypothetical protein